MNVRRLTVLLLILLLLGAAGVAWHNLVDGVAVRPLADEPAVTPDAATLERGQSLARIGNCIGCHSERGGEPLAGGRAIATPFGVVYAPNITPHMAAGIGAWSRSEFFRALHDGRSRDGRLLTPAFPYPNFTRLTREDSDAIYAWLRTQPAVDRANQAHELRWPYRGQTALALWRTLYFRRGADSPEPTREAAWQRGRYLVEGLAHCSACHVARDAFGGAQGAGGGFVGTQHWYAPSLYRADEAGVAAWQEADIVALLRDGVAPQAAVSGPMAEVVARGTRHLSDADASAMAVYLRALPQQAAPRAAFEPAPAEVMRRGEQVYEAQCAVCHGKAGEGRPGAIRPLAGNRAVVMPEPRNVIQAIRFGGFQPETAGNPRPWGMPPFAGLLDDAEIAAVASYLRQSWGNTAAMVTPLMVLQAQ